jgi:hypothetical protein
MLGILRYTQDLASLVNPINNILDVIPLIYKKYTVSWVKMQSTQVGIVFPTQNSLSRKDPFLLNKMCLPFNQLVHQE